ncbi:MAG: hypothetical protein LBJ46_11125 [Planctomycetota bacterium]|nr:hypothetical protein [Planctomycetota bacterium]
MTYVLDSRAVIIFSGTRIALIRRIRIAFSDALKATVVTSGKQLASVADGVKVSLVR